MQHCQSLSGISGTWKLQDFKRLDPRISLRSFRRILRLCHVLIDTFDEVRMVSSIDFSLQVWENHRPGTRYEVFDFVPLQSLEPHGCGDQKHKWQVMFNINMLNINMIKPSIFGGNVKFELLPYDPYGYVRKKSMVCAFSICSKASPLRPFVSSTAASLSLVVSMFFNPIQKPSFSWRSSSQVLGCPSLKPAARGLILFVSEPWRKSNSKLGSQQLYQTIGETPAMAGFELPTSGAQKHTVIQVCPRLRDVEN